MSEHSWADAVNCAYNGRAVNGKHLTDKGVMLLAEAVLAANRHLSREQRASILIDPTPTEFKAQGCQSGE